MNGVSKEVPRVGILGGTFDPIHIGHLILAEEARFALALDRVLFVPAAVPWRKADREITPAADRLAMVRLAISDNPHFEASTIELEREGPSYTADTLDELRSKLGSEVKLWFIVGLDALFDLPYWKDPERIVAQARLAVAERTGHLKGPTPEIERRLPGIRSRVDPVPMPLVEISSSELRNRLRQSRSTRYWLPRSVEKYILERGLYQRL